MEVTAGDRPARVQFVRFGGRGGDGEIPRAIWGGLADRTGLDFVDRNCSPGPSLVTPPRGHPVISSGDGGALYQGASNGSLRGGKQDVAEGGRGYVGKPDYVLRRGLGELRQNRSGQPFHPYHLDRDPQEQNDLENTRRERFDAVAEWLRRHVQQAGRVPWYLPIRDGR